VRVFCWHCLRYPVLLAVDDFQALYCKTKYRDPNFNRIKPYHLSIPRLLLEYASGKKSFASVAKHFPFLGSFSDFSFFALDPWCGPRRYLNNSWRLSSITWTTRSSWPPTPRTEQPILQTIGGFTEVCKWVAEARNATAVNHGWGSWNIRALDEGSSFAQWWAHRLDLKFDNTNYLRAEANDELFLAKYSEASGNPRDFVWGGLLGTLETWVAPHHALICWRVLGGQSVSISRIFNYNILTGSISSSSPRTVAYTQGTTFSSLFDLHLGMEPKCTLSIPLAKNFSI